LQSVEVLIGDVTDQVAVQSAMRGVDAVVHMGTEKGDRFIFCQQKK
jgi:uncharacterized protein YbjT (DUF2867 family)